MHRRRVLLLLLAALPRKGFMPLDLLHKVGGPRGADMVWALSLTQRDALLALLLHRSIIMVRGAAEVVRAARCQRRRGRAGAQLSGGMRSSCSHALVCLPAFGLARRAFQRK